MPASYFILCHFFHLSLLSLAVTISSFFLQYNIDEPLGISLFNSLNEMEVIFPRCGKFLNFV
jgi:hypothetical protein